MSTPDTEKRAPVQGYPGGIPWAIHLEAYEVYCKRWGPQPALIDLEGRNCRGGFGTGELDDFIPGWRDRVSEFGKLKTEVTQLRAKVAALMTMQLEAAEALTACHDALVRIREAGGHSTSAEILAERALASLTKAA